MRKEELRKELEEIMEEASQEVSKWPPWMRRPELEADVRRIIERREAAASAPTAAPKKPSEP